MRIGIYGASGYLGSSIVRKFSELGFKVDCLQRKEHPDQSLYDLVIDASFPSSYKHPKVMLAYTELIQKRLNNFKNTLFVYLGSYSSTGHVRSIYGRTKKAIEDLVKSQGGIVMRIGLVVDEVRPGGRYLQFKRIIDFIPINFRLPDIWCPIMITRLSDFEEAVIRIPMISQVNRSEIHIGETFQGNLNSLLTTAKRRVIKLQLSDRTVEVMFKIVSKFPVGIMDNLNSIGFRHYDRT